MFTQFNLKSIAACTGLFLFLHFSIQLHAQDTLYLQKGSIETGKVYEIGLRTISYKKSALPDGPIYIIDKDEVTRIVFQNGVEEFIGSRFANKKNIVQANLLNMFASRFSFTYERLLWKGRVGIQVPLTFSLEEQFGTLGIADNFIEYPLLYSGGLNIVAYPLKQQKVNYYIGAGCTIGHVEGYTYYGWYGYDGRKTTYGFYYAYVINGMHIRLNDVMDFNTNFKIGIREVVGDGRADWLIFQPGIGLNMRF